MDMAKLSMLLTVLHFTLTIRTTSGFPRVQTFYPQCRPKTNLADYEQAYKIRSDLFCPKEYNNKTCEIQYNLITCACYAVPTWVMKKAQVLPLELEYTGVKGTSILTYTGEKASRHSVVHSNGILSEMPGNLCNFPSIVVIILANNRITSIGSLSCLEELDSIDLSHNLITKVSNDTFQNLTKLRVIDLSYNRIVHIDPHTFFQDGLHSLNPMKINVSDNNLETTDFSNVFMLKPFCVTIYKRNKLKTVTNELGFNVNFSELEDPNRLGGLVDVSDNRIKYLPDPGLFGLSSILEYALLQQNHFIVNFKRNYLHCDCNAGFMFGKDIPILRHYPLALIPYGYRCKTPRVVNLISIDDKNLTDEKLSQLQCKYKCLDKCNCTYTPYTGIILIACKGIGLSKLKGINLDHNFWSIVYIDVIQDFKKADIELDLSENSFKYIPNEPNILRRTKNMDLSKNTIKYLHRSSLRNLPRDVKLNLSYNEKLKTLPRAIIRFHIDNIDFSGLKLDCSCNDVNKMHQWLPDFIRLGRFTDNRTLLCNIDGKLVKAIEINSEYLGCDDNSILNNIFLVSAVCLSIIALGMIGIIVFFRLELFILYRKLRQKECTNKNYEYDVYIVMNSENEILIRWLLKRFCPALESLGYKVYLPPRDLVGGFFREEQIRETIESSRCIIGFMTASFAEGRDEWMALEWRIAWHQYKSMYDRKLICINYDQLRYRDIDLPILKEYFRWGTCIDFCTRQKFIQSCINGIGKPCTNLKVFKVSAKPKFNPLKITQL